MSTRSTTYFGHGDSPEVADIWPEAAYRHHDGYIAGHGADLWDFLEARHAKIQDRCDTYGGDWNDWESELATDVRELAQKRGTADPNTCPTVNMIRHSVIDPLEGDLDYVYLVLLGDEELNPGYRVFFAKRTWNSDSRFSEWQPLTRKKALKAVESREREIEGYSKAREEKLRAAGFTSGW